jgi:cell shape-determining protein MreD
VLRQAGILILIYASIVAQTSLLTDWTSASKPFFPALVLVMIAASSHPAVAVFWSGFAGLILDGVSTERLGVQLGLATILALGLQLFRSIWGSCKVLPLCAAVLTVTTFWKALSPMTYAVLTGRVIDARLALNSAVHEAVATAVVAVLVSFVWRALMRNSWRSGISSESTRRQNAFAAR